MLNCLDVPGHQRFDVELEHFDPRSRLGVVCHEKIGRLLVKGQSQRVEVVGVREPGERNRLQGLLIGASNILVVISPKTRVLANVASKDALQLLVAAYHDRVGTHHDSIPAFPPSITCKNCQMMLLNKQNIFAAPDAIHKFDFVTANVVDLSDTRWSVLIERLQQVDSLGDERSEEPESQNCLDSMVSFI